MALCNVPYSASPLPLVRAAGTHAVRQLPDVGDEPDAPAQGTDRRHLEANQRPGELCLLRRQRRRRRRGGGGPAVRRAPPAAVAGHVPAAAAATAAEAGRRGGGGACLHGADDAAPERVVVLASRGQQVSPASGLQLNWSIGRVLPLLKSDSVSLFVIYVQGSAKKRFVVQVHTEPWKMNTVVIVRIVGKSGNRET